MINKYGRIQGQHVIGAGFLATLLGVLFNLSSSKVSNYLPQLADAATSYANGAVLDPYGYSTPYANQAYSNSAFSNQPYAYQSNFNGYADNYGYAQPLANSSYNSNTLGGRYQNASYTGGSGYLNNPPINNSLLNNGYSNTGYLGSGYPNAAYSSTGYQNNSLQSSGYPNTSYQNTGYSSTGYQGSNYLDNSYQSKNYFGNNYTNSGYPANSYSNSSYLNNSPLNNNHLASTVSYATQSGYPNSYSGQSGYNAAGYSSSNLGRTPQYGAAIRAYFSPNGGCTDAIVRELQQAQRQIYIQAYSFTSEPIAMACVSALRRGVQVVVILDKSQMSEQNSSADFLASSGVTTMIDSTHQIAHNKVILIDGRTIITGSFNFTYNAEHHNAENLLVIHDNLELYAAYDNNFRHCYSHSSVYASRTSNRSTFGYR